MWAHVRVNVNPLEELVCLLITFIRSWEQHTTHSGLSSSIFPVDICCPGHEHDCSLGQADLTFLGLRFLNWHAKNSTFLPYRVWSSLWTKHTDTCKALRTMPDTQKESINIRCYKSYHYNEVWYSIRSMGYWRQGAPMLLGCSAEIPSSWYVKTVNGTAACSRALSSPSTDTCSWYTILFITMSFNSILITPNEQNFYFPVCCILLFASNAFSFSSKSFPPPFLSSHISSSFCTMDPSSSPKRSQVLWMHFRPPLVPILVTQSVRTARNTGPGANSCAFMWCWSKHLTSLCISFFNCKMGYGEGQMKWCV